MEVTKARTLRHPKGCPFIPSTPSSSGASLVWQKLGESPWRERTKAPGCQVQSWGSFRALAVLAASYFQVQITPYLLPRATAHTAGDSPRVSTSIDQEPKDLSTPPFPTAPGPHVPETSVGWWAVPSSPPGPLGASAPPRAFVPEEPPRAVS